VLVSGDEGTVYIDDLLQKEKGEDQKILMWGEQHRHKQGLWGQSKQWGGWSRG
jgi:hypothetical protein